MENLRGSLLMVAAMAGFAVEDMFVKTVAARVPVGEILVVLGAGGAVLFALAALYRRDRLFSADLLSGPVVLRNLGEVIGTIGFILAVALTPLAQASAILQATPLAVTLGAALFLGEKVGWRRWSAILVGFAGVLIVIRPGLSGFNPLSLFAVLGVAGLAARDVVTRRVPKSISSMQLSTYAFAVLVPAGFAMTWVMEETMVMPAAGDALRLIGALIFGVAGYYALVAAMRIGDVAVITPFRYTRLLIALVIGWLVFDEPADAMTLLGGAVIVASGLYTFAREARVRRR